MSGGACAKNTAGKIRASTLPSGLAAPVWAESFGEVKNHVDGSGIGKCGDIGGEIPGSIDATVQ